jgi:hypothetical protein
MPTATLSELESLFQQLQRRMVESGEWDRYGRFTQQLPGLAHSTTSTFLIFKDPAAATLSAEGFRLVGLYACPNFR